MEIVVSIICIICVCLFIGSSFKNKTEKISKKEIIQYRRVETTYFYNEGKNEDIEEEIKKLEEDEDMEEDLDKKWIFGDKDELDIDEITEIEELFEWCFKNFSWQNINYMLHNILRGIYGRFWIFKKDE